MPLPAKYRKKPVVIEAMQWLPDDLAQAGSVIGWTQMQFSVGDGLSLLVPTLEGTMAANPGDWIIKGLAGEFYPCKPEIFEASYEKAE